MSNNLYFKHSLKCSSFNDKPYSRNIKHGGKIILCQTLFKFYSSAHVKYPMMFEIVKHNKRVHCGMIEFTANKGEMYLRQWMMTQLNICNGEKAFIKYCQPNHGKSIQFQPHQSTFLDIDDHKSVLEKSLVNFACLSIGDTIPILYNDHVYYGDVVDCKPGRNISIIDCDLEVDFKSPKDYQEPLKAQQSQGVHETHDTLDTDENEETSNRKFGPMIDYKAGCLSFAQERFKSRIDNETDDKTEKIFIPFQGRGYRWK